MIENRFKKGLGRGLSSLIGDSSKKIETNKIVLITSLRIVKCLSLLGLNLSCIIIKLYLNLKIKTKL